LRAQAAAPAQSLLAMLFSVRLSLLLSMAARVCTMARRGMSVMGCLLVMAGFVVFGRFAMVLRSMGVVFGCFGVMFRSFLRHRISSSARMILRYLNSCS
jgi:hypothetical protein